MRALYRPAYSNRWLGRHFILTESSFRWGRYAIADQSFHESSKEDWDTAAGLLRELKPEVIATGFEELLLQFLPMCFKDYLEEISALYTYELARKNLEALRRVECEPSEYVAARENVAARFQDALLTVFNSASQTHGLGKAEGVRYSQILHGMHIAAIFIQGTTVYAAYTPDLVLESVAGNDNFRLWPPYPSRENVGGERAAVVSGNCGRTIG